MKPFHSAAGGLGLYHCRADCSDGKRIKPYNRCDAGYGEMHVDGCIWVNAILDPCLRCGTAWAQLGGRV